MVGSDALQHARRWGAEGSAEIGDLLGEIHDKTLDDTREMFLALRCALSCWPYCLHFDGSSVTQEFELPSVSIA
ncbi:hypothetical protein ACWCQK_26645 [Streptomyces sp. NPDC002306]